MTESIFHPFPYPLRQTDLPKEFTYPFHYTPHPLCIQAADEVQEYVGKQERWIEELRRGKMFGVLIVQDRRGTVGYLAAFSGILDGTNNHPFFVPPVYELLRPEGFFRLEEENISAINKQIEVLRTDERYVSCQRKLKEETEFARKDIEERKNQLRKAKLIREERRKNNPTETERTDMIRESQYQKAEFKRAKQYWKEHLDHLQAETDHLSKQIEKWKEERKQRSSSLQQKLFRQFRMLNAQGEYKDLCDIFKDTVQKVPPAGAGECAAPKLLQYAYRNDLKPIAMAEFWWGDSPQTEIRRHGYYYPACKGKCEPILNHMLTGLKVAKNPLLNSSDPDTKPEIVYEDEWLAVVCKPAGMLSVPGKTGSLSIYDWARNSYPQITGPVIVHRLDMSTSGLLLIAKTKEVHQHLQAQFKHRSIKKRYIAILDGLITEKEGMISLPLCADPADRPRQIASLERGKPAVTRYEVLSIEPGRTRIAFYPLTGRTHQLRVHAAHPRGLRTSILGDELYGRKADRLYLHAEYLEFEHPVSKQTICVEKKAPF